MTYLAQLTDEQRAGGLRNTSGGADFLVELRSAEHRPETAGMAGV